MSTNLVEQITAKAAALPPNKQRQALEIIESLMEDEVAIDNEVTPDKSQPARRSLLGIFADRGVDVTADDIDEARREMWKNFPREDIVP